MQPEQRPEIVRRLRCAAGHLNAVIEMTEAGQLCEQVLHQLNAVQAALRVTAAKIILCEAQNSEAVIVHGASPKQRLAELKRLQSLYTIFMQHSNHSSEVSND